MHELLIYKKTFDGLTKKLKKLSLAVDALDLITLQIAKQDLQDLAVGQISQLRYSIEDQHTHESAIIEFLNSEDLVCFEAPNDASQFKIRLFTAKGLEKSIFLGTPLDWFNISDQLVDAISLEKELRDAWTGPDAVAVLGGFDEHLLKQAYLQKILSALNALRTCHIAVKGYALYRVEKVLGANSEFYVNNLLGSCLAALPVLKQMEEICEIASVPVKDFNFSFENTHILNKLSEQDIKNIANEVSA